MAGSYPDVPGYRFAYDLDGTTVINYNTSEGTQETLTSGSLTVLNNDDFDTFNYPGYRSQILVFFFPEPRTLKGMMLNGGTNFNNVQWSNDTTDGIDGTWTTISGIGRINSVSSESLRNNISIISPDLTNVSSIRFSWTTDVGDGAKIKNIHLYGLIANTESPDRLRIVDTSDNDISAQMDFGNMPQRSSATRQFKVTNNSSSKTANSVTVSLSPNRVASPALVGQFEVSTDNIAFANAVNIGSLAPGVSSGTMYLRMKVASNAQLSAWSARIIAHAASWS